MIVNGALVVTSLVAALCLAEGILRLHHGPPGPVSDPSPYRTLTPEGSRLVPHADVLFVFESTTQPVRVTINSLGLRGPEPEAPSRGKPRVLFLGDSVTFGYGVAEESTFVGRLRAEGAASSPGWEAMNGGIEDAGIQEELGLLIELGAALRFDAVVLCFYPNDSRPPVGFSQEYLQEDPVDRWLRTHPRVLTRSRLAAFIHFRYRRFLTRLQLYRSPIPARFAWVELWQEGTWRHDTSARDSLVALARFDWGAGWQDEGWPLVQETLEAICKWCRSRGVWLGVCYSPVQVEAEGPTGGVRPSDRLERTCQMLDIPFLDLLPSMAGISGCYIDQCHYTLKGHTIASRSLAAWLWDQWLPAPEFRRTGT